MSWILTIDTDDDCWINYVNPVNGEACSRQSYLRAEFTGNSHFTKLSNFLNSFEVEAKPEKEGHAKELKGLIQKLKGFKGVDFCKGGNITVSYKKAVVKFSI